MRLRKNLLLVISALALAGCSVDVHVSSSSSSVDSSGTTSSQSSSISSVARTYTITFDDATHTELEVTFNEKIGTLPDVPSVKGKINGRWTIEGTTITSETIYKWEKNTLATAIYDDATYTLTFSGTETTKTLKYGEAIGTLPDITAREGYTACWTIDDEAITSETLYNYETNKTAAVKYTANQYTITFDNTDVVPMTVTFGEAIGTLPTLEAKIGKTNARWVVEGETITSETIYKWAKNTTAIATYDDVEYTLTFSGTTTTKTLKYGEAIGELPAIPAKEGEHSEYYSGVWMIDGRILSDSSVYEFAENKTAIASYTAIFPTIQNGDTVDIANEKIAGMYSTDDLVTYVQGIAKAPYDYSMKKVKLAWETLKDFNFSIVTVSLKEDMSNAESYLTYNDYIELDNLLTDTTYYYQVKGCFSNDDYIESQVLKFKTGETIRTLDIDGVDNIRDIGSLPTSIAGKKLKQGMIFRSATLDSLTEKGKAQLKEIYGIKTELDLREKAYWKDNSYIDSSIAYKHVTSENGGVLYLENGSTGINDNGGKATLKEELQVFTSEANYPIDMHCAIGRDRTGTLAMVLEALLGVEEDDIYIDYLVSHLSESGNKDSAAVKDTYANIKATLENIKNSITVGTTLAEKTENYLTSVIGLTSDEVSSIKNVMMEDK